MSQFERLKELLRDKKATIGIIGLGYVGLPIVIRFCEEGFNVLGFDVDPAKTEKLNKGKSYIKHIPSEKLSNFTSGSKPAFEATTDMSRLGEVEVTVICVPTPLSDKREPDLSYVVDTAEKIARNLRPGTLISLESTTYPGTTHDVLLPMFNEKGLKEGTDFFLVFSPEREDPGRKDFTTRNTPKIVGGITPKCTKLGSLLYSQIVENIVETSSAGAAEMTKLLENIYRSVNIALVNELKMLCDRMDIDLWEVIDAAKTKPFGFQAFYPGPGLGGHCIPIDPFYLTWKAREYDFATRFIELAGEINTSMPYFVVGKVADALNGKKKSVKGAKVLVLGVAYKKNVDDIRESPSMELIRLLKEKGAKVSYNDPHISNAVSHRRSFHMHSTPLTEKRLAGFDCVLIATDHDAYDYKWIVDNSKLVVDTRNATNGIKNGKIFKA